MENKLQPAIIGGVALGLLSAIPFVNLLNVCCCAWAIIGGVIAAFLYIKKSPVPARIGDGAILGALAGVIGSIIYCIVGIPLSIVMGDTFNAMVVKLLANINPAQAEEMRRQLELAQNMPLSARLPSLLFGAFISFVLLTIFSVIGGLIGTAIFEKRKGDTNVPPPPTFDNQPGGGYPGGGYGAGA